MKCNFQGTVHHCQTCRRWLGIFLSIPPRWLKPVIHMSTSRKKEERNFSQACSHIMLFLCWNYRHGVSVGCSVFMRTTVVRRTATRVTWWCHTARTWWTWALRSRRPAPRAAPCCSTSCSAPEKLGLPLFNFHPGGVKTQICRWLGIHVVPTSELLRWCDVLSMILQCSHLMNTNSLFKLLSFFICRTFTSGVIQGQPLNMFFAIQSLYLACYSVVKNMRLTFELWIVFIYIHNPVLFQSRKF